jgi:hypothetical protein
VTDADDDRWLDVRIQVLLLFVGFVAFGVVVGWFGFPAEWAATTRLAGGVGLGVGAGFILLVNRMLG